MVDAEQFDERLLEVLTAVRVHALAVKLAAYVHLHIIGANRAFDFLLRVVSLTLNNLLVGDLVAGDGQLGVFIRRPVCGDFLDLLLGKSPGVEQRAPLFLEALFVPDLIIRFVLVLLGSNVGSVTLELKEFLVTKCVVVSVKQ